mgnify:CR=1 FL=1
MRELLLKALAEDEVNLAIVNEIKGNPSRITFYSNKGDVLLTVLISVTTTNERLNLSPSKLKIVSEVQKLNCLSDILGFELVDKAEDNYIHITGGYEDLIAKINEASYNYYVLDNPVISDKEWDKMYYEDFDE